MPHISVHDTLMSALESDTVSALPTMKASGTTSSDGKSIAWDGETKRSGWSYYITEQFPQN
jgi:hypothetical protein